MSAPLLTCLPMLLYLNIVMIDELLFTFDVRKTTSHTFNRIKYNMEIITNGNKLKRIWTLSI